MVDSILNYFFTDWFHNSKKFSFRLLDFYFLSHGRKNSQILLNIAQSELKKFQQECNITPCGPQDMSILTYQLKQNEKQRG